MKENKNILQMVEHLLPGGAERMAVNISNLLSENGYNSYLCATRALGALENNINPVLKYVCLNKKHFLDIKAFFILNKFVVCHKIDILHAHSSSIYWAFLIKLLHPKIKILWHDHYGYSETLKDSDRSIIRWISFSLSGIISVNAKLHNWSLKNCKVRSEKIVQINNFPSFNNSLFDIYKKEKKIVLLGNLRPQKDHIAFIKAICEIRETIIQHNYKINFAGLYWEDDYYKEMIRLIKINNLLDFFEFSGSVEDVQSLLLTVEIGVLSSVSEGLPVSLLEYGLAGLPVVVTNVGQCAEVVDYGNAGLVVPPSNPEAIAKALLDLIEHPEKRKLYGNRLKERVEKEYGTGKFLKEYEKLIERL